MMSATDGFRGELVVVATPIGNMGDLSPRAIEALASAELIGCEDTRRTGRLLAAVGISAPKLLRVDAHTERDVLAVVLARLGRPPGAVALVSDAGTPVIADPGQRVIEGVLQAGHRVSHVPGPSALVTALVVSGLDSTRFVFEGFLARKGPTRRSQLDLLADQERTAILYEAPHRIERTVTDLHDRLGGERRIAICRELTKLHEEVWRGTLEQAVSHVSETKPRGEYVIVLGGASPGPEASDHLIRQRLREQIDAGLSTRDAARAVALELGVGRRRVYELASDHD